MNKEKEIEKIGKVMCKEFRSEHCGNDCECANEFIAETLIDAGYGNVKQAVKEFGERIKDFIFQNTSIGCVTVCGEEYPVNKLSCTPEALYDKIDDFMTELYGGDE